MYDNDDTLLKPKIAKKSIMRLNKAKNVFDKNISSIGVRSIFKKRTFPKPNEELSAQYINMKIT